jgi:hypothetical protein
VNLNSSVLPVERVAYQGIKMESKHNKPKRK